MKKRKLILAISMIFIPLFILSCSSNGQKEISVNIYMIAYEGSNLSGKAIGCNEILVPITKNVLVENNEVEAALNELLATPSIDELKNYVKGPSLIVYQVTIANGIADVYLKGDFDISGICDISRIKEQLYETAKQFSDIKTVKIYVNDKTLEAYLSESEQGFK